MIILFLQLMFFFQLKMKREKIISIIDSSVVWNTLAIFIVYILSIWSAINRITLLVIYIAVNVLMFFLIGRDGWKTVYCKLCIKLYVMISFIKNIKSNYFEFFIIIFIFGYGVIALLMVPYTWDSMVYHIPRICMWAQNQSISYYATEIGRQLASPNQVAYISTIIYVMSNNNERILNLVQFIAYVIDGFFVYSLCSQLGIDSRTIKSISVIIWLMHPMAFAQASSTQNDLFASIWVMFLAYLILSYDKDCKTRQDSLEWVIRLACIVGLGYVSKPSVCVAVLFVLIWYLQILLSRKATIREIISQIAIAIPVVLLYIAPQHIQNMISFGKLSPDYVNQRQLVGTLNPKYLIVNFVKNITYNLGFRLYGTSIGTDGIITKILLALSKGLKVDLDSPVISEDGMPFGFVKLPAYNCDAALAPVVSLLIIVSVIIIAINWKKISYVNMKYIKVVLASFVFFCFILRWERYISRYMIVYFALCIPIVAIALDILVSDEKVHKKIMVFVCILSLCGIELVGEVRYLVEVHPIFKGKSYFVFCNDNYEKYESVLQLADSLDAKSVGLIMGGDSYEYPIWQLIDKDAIIKNVNVTSELQELEDISFVPEIIISCVNSEEQDKLVCHEKEYKFVEGNNVIQLYEINQ